MGGDSMRPQHDTNVVSVVMPAHEEADVIEMAIREVRRAVEETGLGWEIIVVDDGSRDETFERVRCFAERNPGVRGLRLSRNFGKEAAILAGLRAASGRAVITIDADLQHPPSLIPEMVRQWQEGAKVINGLKHNQYRPSSLNRAGVGLFNAALARFAGLQLKDASDFKLLDRIVVDAIVSDFPERTRFYRGLADWVGYEQVSIPFEVEERAAGVTKWSLWGLIRLAVSAVISFTAMPLRIVTLMGVMTLVLGLGVGTDALISWIRGEAVSGFATIIITLCIIGSFIMISLGIMGEYISRIFQETKRRPAYLIEAHLGFDEVNGQPPKNGGTG